MQAEELGFKRDELARAEKLFEMIAQRLLQLQTERSAPSRVKLMQVAEPPQAPVESFPYKRILGVYYLPEQHLATWRRLAGGVEQCQEGNVISTIRAAMDEGTARAVRDALSKLVQEEATKLVEDVSRGTLMAGLIVAAAEERPVPKAILVVSDGYTGWPAKPVGPHVMACLTRASTAGSGSFAVGAGSAGQLRSTLPPN